MRNLLPRLITALPLCAMSAVAAPQDFIVPAGTTQVFDTNSGRIVARTIHIESGAVLRVVGGRPLMMRSMGDLVVDGVLDLSGHSSPGVLTLNTTNIPEPGAAGSAGAGEGGRGSFLTNASTPIGGSGQAGFGALLFGGGGGGESCFALGPVANRRAAGGAGGVLAPDRPFSMNPGDPANIGLIAEPGEDGSPSGFGALHPLVRAQGGALGARPFFDNNPDNDFWGFKQTPSGQFIAGELARPLAGSGGGAGGDAIQSAVFPSPAPFSPAGDEKGCGGGGGGGLGLIVARKLIVGPGGRIVADGGDGGGGENTLFFDRIGGGSGGGSGGMLVIQAGMIDLTAASAGALSARGGRGGEGAQNLFSAVGAGGDGGPGIIQLHPSTPAMVMLPPGLGLDTLSAPEAHVLLPILQVQ